MIGRGYLDAVEVILIPITILIISVSLWGLEIFIAGLNKKYLEISRFIDVFKGKWAKIGWYLMFWSLFFMVVFSIFHFWIDDWYDLSEKIINTVGVFFLGSIVLVTLFFSGRGMIGIKTPRLDKLLKKKETKREENFELSIDTLMEKDNDTFTIKRTTKTARINLRPSFPYIMGSVLILIGLSLFGFLLIFSIITGILDWLVTNADELLRQLGSLFT
jgi:hypothetical protein